jgi:transposase
MPPEKTIPFTLPGFEIDQVDQYEDTVVIQAHSATTWAICPYCGQSSGSVHSYYSRSPRDLPCSGWRVRLVLGVRRFRCRNETCDHQTFAERIPHIVPVHGQRTTRLTAVLRAIAFEVTAEAGARISAHLKMVMSADTLLRVIRQTCLASTPTPRVLGVDDWAIKKGNRYGTILVDLEEHRPVDLLADRTAETLAAWLKVHPGIEIISRDRSNEDIAGINEGAPQATQVADRWHLLRNLSEALQRLVEKHARALRTAAQQVQTATDPPSDDENTEITNETRAVPSRRELRFAEVKRLAKKGHSRRAIARLLRMSTNTVRRYLEAEDLPKYQLRGPRAPSITPYVAHLEARWAEGCHNSRILWEEFASKGIPAATAVFAVLSDAIVRPISRPPLLRRPRCVRCHRARRRGCWSLPLMSFRLNKRHIVMPYAKPASLLGLLTPWLSVL